MNTRSWVFVLVIAVVGQVVAHYIIKKMEEPS